MDLDFDFENAKVSTWLSDGYTSKQFNRIKKRAVRNANIHIFFRKLFRKFKWIEEFMKNITILILNFLILAAIVVMFILDAGAGNSFAIAGALLITLEFIVATASVLVIDG